MSDSDLHDSAPLTGTKEYFCPSLFLTGGECRHVICAEASFSTGLSSLKFPLCQKGSWPCAFLSTGDTVATNCQVKGSGHGTARLEDTKWALTQQVVGGLVRIDQTWHQVLSERGRVFAGKQVC